MTPSVKGIRTEITTHKSEDTLEVSATVHRNERYVCMGGGRDERVANRALACAVVSGLVVVHASANIVSMKTMFSQPYLSLMRVGQVAEAVRQQATLRRRPTGSSRSREQGSQHAERFF